MLLYQSSLRSLSLLGRGKVRDMYAVDAERLLIVTSDRLSAFDVVLDDPIPDKGRVLNAMSLFWFGRLGDIVPNHLSPEAPESLRVESDEREQIRGRSMLVKRLQPLPLECVVRGYLAGSGWKDYRKTGGVCGIPLPPGLHQAERLPEVLFTPATKAEQGEHDQNIAFAEAARMVGAERAEQVREISVALYRTAAQHALARGIIIADTKFEFGLDVSGRLHLIDEALTPDSSRFWPASEYRPGSNPPSFDKQFVRDYLEQQDWNKVAPAPRLPPEVIAATSAKYREAYQRLVGEPLPG
jgi:phosphoribosylaminoimidazole-succinocarboxamide synthase